MLSRTAAGRILIGVGVVGAAVAVGASVLGWRLLSDLEEPLAGGMGVSGQAVEALGSSVDVAQDAVVVLERGLQQTESTTRDLAVAFGDAEAVVGATADISDQRIAESLEAVEQAMPTLVNVAGVIDRTLTSLSAVPFAPDYRPEEPFDESLRTLQAEVAGLSDELRAQAALLREGRDSLSTVREGTVAIADDMGDLQTTLEAALQVLRNYSATAAEAGDLVGPGQTGWSQQLMLGRVLVVVLGATLLVAQTVPLGLGWFLLRPDAAAALVAD